MVFASPTGDPLQLIRPDEYDGHEYRCVLEGCECVWGAGCKIDEITGTQNLVPFIHLEINFTFDTLNRYRSIDRMHRHSFASRKNDPHDFEALLLEQCRGRSLFKPVAER
ncbi:hypothetical protein R69927_04157 [Paraburkholderia domus]|jgi:hypothetical protein|uniref:Uncharacterized protein n=1 Tax=Paraburkholderia domus TaxID=2793075 RepID=A0A9N8QZB0_9BURK|nr:hypothetical protein R70006_04139 [Paraburkholderia domus]CAE6785714.1 hypothetical protein R75483_04663 [Paraburkholderia domus]CAE6879532.1 hypothetical protein R69927_04157 [Paraburkholderia domus]CAE6887919.1 hypothetical protein R70211_02526 [Paraburkholderia domus]CAE6895053.1 hypothetical protein R75471_02619 [Paraburkholderia domus]